MARLKKVVIKRNYHGYKSPKLVQIIREESELPVRDVGNEHRDWVLRTRLKIRMSTHETSYLEASHDFPFLLRKTWNNTLQQAICCFSCPFQ